ncbi:hypothetical protein CC80DRAFT_288934 [Byssothecium circinans]|uniref:Uncharacterized protein n=1 Tax=Byssothecium circinans TaxID=147558 RepID=A0A6A5U5R6_9PLEO|nr:hypothetical protein CC80DRAFT_288934 [Byssothecium circinans]
MAPVHRCVPCTVIKLPVLFTSSSQWVLLAVHFQSVQAYGERKAVRVRIAAVHSVSPRLEVLHPTKDTAACMREACSVHMQTRTELATLSFELVQCSSAGPRGEILDHPLPSLPIGTAPGILEEHMPSGTANVLPASSASHYELASTAMGCPMNSTAYNLESQSSGTAQYLVSDVQPQNIPFCADDTPVSTLLLRRPTETPTITSTDLVLKCNFAEL